MEKHMTNEETGISYILDGDYYLSDLALPDSGDCQIGVFGKQHGDYLKKNRRVVYTELLTTGKLHSYLADIDEQARERLELLVKQMAAQEGVTETLKAEKQMLRVQKMNNIHNRALKIVRTEIVYI